AALQPRPARASRPARDRHRRGGQGRAGAAGRKRPGTARAGAAAALGPCPDRALPAGSRPRRDGLAGAGDQSRRGAPRRRRRVALRRPPPDRGLGPVAREGLGLLAGLRRGGAVPAVRPLRLRDPPALAGSGGGAGEPAGGVGAGARPGGPPPLSCRGPRHGRCFAFPPLGSPDMRRLPLALAAILLASCRPAPPADGAADAAAATEVPAFAFDEAGIAGLQQRMRAGTLSSRELAQAYLDRIAAVDDAGPRLGAVIE